MSRPSLPRNLRTFTWLLGLAVVIAGLHGLAQGPLTGPGLSMSDLRAWAASRAPLEVGLTFGRLAALATAYYLAVVVAMASVADAARRPHLVRVVERCTAPPFRRLVRHVAGLTLTASTLLASPVVAGAQGPSAGSAVMVVVADEESTPSTSLDLGPSGTEAEPRSGEEAGGAATEPGQTPGGPTDRTAPDPVLHLVVPGDHLWSLAQGRMEELSGTPPSGAAVAAYWRQVVAANPQLADPDLLFCGDLITLPDPGPLTGVSAIELSGVRGAEDPRSGGHPESGGTATMTVAWP